MKTKLYQVIIAKSDSSDDNLYTYAFPPITSKKVERIRFPGKTQRIRSRNLINVKLVLKSPPDLAVSGAFCTFVTEMEKALFISCYDIIKLKQDLNNGKTTY